MTEREFVAKWKHKLADCHPNYSSHAGPLYWCASYDEESDFIAEITEDFLSTTPTEGMSLRRALRIRGKLQDLAESGPPPFKVGDVIIREGRTEKLVIQNIFFVRNTSSGIEPYWCLIAKGPETWTEGAADCYRLADDA